jgi:hypothetical protein
MLILHLTPPSFDFGKEIGQDKEGKLNNTNLDKTDQEIRYLGFFFSHSFIYWKIKNIEKPTQVNSHRMRTTNRVTGNYANAVDHFQLFVNIEIKQTGLVCSLKHQPHI